MLARAAGCGPVGMDSNTDFFGRERFVSLKRYVRARREPREYSHDHGQQTERCYRVRRIRLRRRHCDRRVLGASLPGLKPIEKLIARWFGHRAIFMPAVPTTAAPRKSAATTSGFPPLH